MQISQEADKVVWYSLSSSKKKCGVCAGDGKQGCLESAPQWQGKHGLVRAGWWQRLCGKGLAEAGVQQERGS